MEHIEQYLSGRPNHGNQTYELPSLRNSPREVKDNYTDGYCSSEQRRLLFILSAKDEDACRAMSINLGGYLKGREDNLKEEEFLDNLAYTLAQRRTVFPWITAVTANSTQELIDALEDKIHKPTRRQENLRLGFVFTGQGSQWYAMGRELIHTYPVFKDSILAADKHINSLGADWSIMSKSIESPWYLKEGF